MYEENNKNNTGRQVLLSVLAVAILVVAVIGVSFAFFTYSRQGSTENTISTGTLVFKYNEETAGIELTNAMPISDSQVSNEAVDSKNESFEFNVTSTIKGNMDISYDIVVEESTDPDKVKTLESKYVRLCLKKGATEGTYNEDVVQAKFFNELDTYNGNAKQKKLYSGTFKSADLNDKDNNQDSHYYRFQMWFSDHYYDEDKGAESITSNDTKTNMFNDVCTKDGKDAECKCEITDDTTVSSMTDESKDCKLSERGTNGKTFSVRLNVYAADKAPVGA